MSVGWFKNDYSIILFSSVIEVTAVSSGSYVSYDNKCIYYLPGTDICIWCISIVLNQNELINHIKEVYMYTYKRLLLLYQLARYYHPGRSLIWRWCESASLIIAWWLLCLLLWICGTVASRIIWLYSVRKSGKWSYLSYGD